MSREITKILCFIIAFAAVSCGVDASKRAAESLFAMATEATASGDYERAIALIDSIDTAYPDQVAVRRNAMQLKPEVIEKQTVKQLGDLDGKIAICKAEGDSLQRSIVKVNNIIEPYYVAKTREGRSVVGKTGLEARMMPDGTFYLISSYNGKAGHTGVVVSNGSESAATAMVAHDGERNDRSGRSEVIHYMPGECDSLSSFIAGHSSEPLTITFAGGNAKTTALDAEDATAIATLYNAAANVRKRTLLELEKQHLEAQLALSRKHRASMMK